MSAPKAPPGWYPDPEGNQRYWDGDNWLEIPPPQVDTKTGTAKPKTKRRRTLTVVTVVFALLVAAGGTGAYILKARADEQAAAVAAQEEAQREEKAAADAAAEAEQEQLATKRLRSEREGVITSIETSITEMAQGHLEEGLIDGSIIDVHCTPVQGGSAEPLLEDSTVFECFVATQELSDGQQRGYYYNATMNWTTGSFTFGFGEP